MSNDKNTGSLYMLSKDGGKINGNLKSNGKQAYKIDINANYNNKRFLPFVKGPKHYAYKDTKHVSKVAPFDDKNVIGHIYDETSENNAIFKHLAKKERQKYLDEGYIDKAFKNHDNSKHFKTKNTHLAHYDYTQQTYRQYDKQKYLLANCQFVILNDAVNFLKDNNGFIDPDFVLEWEHVQQVILWCEEIPVCPICLDQPVPAKLTKCGHVYCWPCILHYLDLGNKYWRRCPICFESIKKDDLKSACIKLVKKYAPGAQILFVLMQRLKNSILCSLAKFGENDVCDQDHCLFDAKDSAIFNKFHIVSLDYVFNKIIDIEEGQLLVLADDPENASEISYIQDALSMLKGYSSVIKSKIAVRETDGHNYMYHLKGNTLSQNPSSTSKDFFYFYQSEDGQAIYLHPCNVRMLLEQRGGRWEDCPYRLIACPILEMENHVQTPEGRKRFHFLSHLPLYKAYRFAEICLASTLDENGIMASNPDILEQFSEMLRDRSAKRAAIAKKLERDELKNQGRFLETASDPYAYYQPRVDCEPINLESETDFPSASLPSTSKVPDTSDLSCASISASPSLPSFAQLLYDAKTVGWRDVSKKNSSDSNNAAGSTFKNDGTNCSEPDSEDEIEADPELSMYLWRKHDNNHSINNHASTSQLNAPPIADADGENMSLPQISNSKKKKKRNFIRVIL